MAVIAIVEDKLLEHTLTKPLLEKHKRRNDDDSEDEE